MAGECADEAATQAAQSGLGDSGGPGGCRRSYAVCFFFFIFFIFDDFVFRAFFPLT